MSEVPKVPAIPFTVIVPTVFGQMLVNRHDMYQANPLFKTGRPGDYPEILMLDKILRYLGTDTTFLDIGANMGTYALGLAPAVGALGKVHAFEPQRLIYNLLVGSVAINALQNVYCHHVALGDHDGRVEIPQFDYNQHMNFGGVEFAPEQSEQLPQPRGHDPAKVEFVPLKTIDSYEFPSVHVMKIDVEGMEPQVIRGAVETIKRCRPVMYVEFMKCGRDALQQSLAPFDYALTELGFNSLCVPSELAGQIRIDREPPTDNANT